MHVDARSDRKELGMTFSVETISAIITGYDSFVSYHRVHNFQHRYN